VEVGNEPQREAGGGRTDADDGKFNLIRRKPQQQ